jgi:hypothetical protein
MSEARSHGGGDLEDSLGAWRGACPAASRPYDGGEEPWRRRRRGPACRLAPFCGGLVLFGGHAWGLWGSGSLFPSQSKGTASAALSQSGYGSVGAGAGAGAGARRIGWFGT